MRGYVRTWRAKGVVCIHTASEFSTTDYQRPKKSISGRETIMAGDEESGNQAGSTQAYSRWQSDLDSVSVNTEGQAPRVAGGEGSWQTGVKGIVIKILIIILIFMFGLVIGYVIRREVHKKISSSGGISQDYDEKIAGQLLQEVSVEELEDQLRHFSTAPHLAGMQEVGIMAEEITSQWQSWGLNTTVRSYYALLSYPDLTNPNKVFLMSGDSVTETITPDDAQSARDSTVPPYAAYSKSGMAMGKLVYVNFGRGEDFHFLESQGVNLTGRIAIARLGQVYVGDKVRHAEMAGAAALLLYPDPAQYQPAGADRGWTLPEDGVFRGDVRITYGDPLTPGYPALEGMFRLSESEADLPGILVQPISIADARKVLGILDGTTAPSDWQGMTQQIDQREDNNRQVRVQVNNKLLNKQIKNVIASISGAVEPDRYVVVGNHRDAWTYGGVEPSTGTACLMELTRTVGLLLKKNWRPRRSIIFASWDGGEFGQIGSTEWVEENIKEMGEKAVAYLNLDGAVIGNFSFYAEASPLLQKVVQDASKTVRDPHGVFSVYNEWVEKFPAGPNAQTPKVDLLGAGSDYAAFLLQAGVPSLDLQYTLDPGFNLSFYPVYHTVYDTFYYVKNFIDPDLSYHRAVTQVLGNTLLRLSDSTLLPFSLGGYAMMIEDFTNAAEASYKNKFKQQGLELQFSKVKLAAEGFALAAAVVEENAGKTDLGNPLEVRRVNDKMMQVDRLFLTPGGVLGKPLYKHLLLSPSKNDCLQLEEGVCQYRGKTFPGLFGAMREVESTGSWANVEKQISIISIAIQSATEFLKK
ncbi:N-acetylated-alpha-linked acidic dipeptidase 2-like [Branchiostoma lanceolatum]|uniref:N-acetylated-alpha-linked acidic dipeptidase 2-like n=1 Tax=Branchiostoma lanceolatum TaxID=7740 RepID=UPI00345314F3